MSCDVNLTPAVKALRKKTLSEIAAEILAGKRKVTRNALGQAAIEGWAETSAKQSGWCDGCALRALQVDGSWALRTKLAQGQVSRAPFVSAGHAGHSH